MATTRNVQCIGHGRGAHAPKVLGGEALGGTASKEPNYAFTLYIYSTNGNILKK